ncbi:MAG: serine/threonine-protein kinase, partial [Chloroflexota bacterium]|nr:serine/threonine-protein kinase [Chloroflexota bacterium]
MEISIKPNDIISSYRFEHPIGHGAYGMVWKGHHEHLDVPVAIKAIDTHDLDAQNLERVKQECRVGGKLTHKEYVVEVRDAFPEGDRFFIVMELMTGGSLERYLRDHPHPDFGLTLAWALDLCAALEQVHALGVVHRDIKPQNVLLTDDAQVKLSDFGVAHLPESGLTTVYQPGTPGYRAPEQESNQPVDGGADVYALCAVLFEIWTGQKYVRYKHADRGIVREEMALLLVENYPDLSLGLRDRLAEAVLAGLRLRPARISLADLQSVLRTIRADRQHGEPGDEAVAAARAQVAQQIKPPTTSTVISHLPQWPVAARSRPPGRTALTEWLEDHFGRWYRQSPAKDVVLWCDPDRAWEPLLDYLSPNLNLLRFQGSLLEIRYQLERRSLDQLTVVYLPMKMEQEEANYLLPYHFTSHVFDKALYDFLLENETPLPRSGLDRQEIRAMLPQLAQASIGKGPNFWDGVTSVEQAWAALVPDFAGQLGQFLNQPVETRASLQQADRADYFQAMIASRLSYAAPLRDPASYARGLVAHLCLVDLYWQAGGPDDFPLAHLLPDAHCFDACRGTLTTWRYDSRYQSRFAEYARAIEADYPGLIEWAQAHADRLDDPSLPGVACAIWEQTAAEITGWSSFAEAADYTEHHRSRIQRTAKGFWSALGETPGWAALALADELMRTTGPVLDELNRLKSLAEVIRAYDGSWWQVDRIYRQCKSAVQVSFPGDTALAGWVDRFYTRFLTETNQHWTSLLNDQDVWGFPGILPGQATFWEKMAGSKASRRAVFLVDALR